MAVSPSTAAQLHESELEDIEKAELAVDRILKASYGGRASETVRISQPIADLSTRCRDELIRRYRNAGWSVDVEISSRPSGYEDYTVRYSEWIFTAAV